jgi:hypothetical protein
MKPSKTQSKLNPLFAAFLLVALMNSNSQSATIGIGSAFGSFVDLDGSALTEGGVSIGFFTVTLPTSASVASITSYAQFQSTFGYQDVRSLLDSNGNPPVYTGSATWDFTTGWTGATLTVPAAPSNPPANAYNTADLLTTFTAGSTSGTALYALAFNKGNYSNGFAGSTRWAVVSASAFGLSSNDWVYPTSSENIQLSQINVSGEVIAGTDGVNVLGGVANNVYLTDMVPEPSTGALMMIGAAGLVALRRLRKD